VLAFLGRGEARPGTGGQTREEPGLAARTRAHVEPPGIGRANVCPSQSDGRQLAGLVLHPCPAFGDGADRRGVAFGQVPADRRPPGCRAAARHQLVPPGKPRNRAHVHHRTLVVGGQHRLGLRQAATGLLAQRRGESFHDPARVAVGHRQVTRRVGLADGCDDVQPPGEIPAGNAPEHRVDQS
jgi:hypothetical protein